MAGKVTGLILIGFERAGFESFVTKAERFAARWVSNASLGTPNLRHRDSLCRETLCGQWFAVDRIRSVSRKKTFPR